MAPITAEEVAKYLEENPDFFLENSELVQTSGLLAGENPGPNLLDIRNRLFDRLNEERRELMNLLDETIGLVRQNEKIEEDFMAIEKILFQGSPDGGSLSEVAQEIESRFSLDHVSILLDESAKGAIPADGNSNGSSRVRLAGDRDVAPDGIILTGNLEEGAAAPFPEMARADLRSTAVVPLREGDQPLGLLLLGSKNSERYIEGMATQLLARLAMRMGMGICLIRRLAGGDENPAPAKPLQKKKKAGLTA
jgi:uncharacterized protein YigA (DUF484 family)